MDGAAVISLAAPRGGAAIGVSWQSLHNEIVARGYSPNGPIRELYLRSEPAPQSEWVTELQQPVAPA